MNPTTLVRTVQAEGGDGNVERLAGNRYDHMVRANHEARRSIERRTRGILKRLPRPQQRLFADNAWTVHMLCPAARVGDLPGSSQQPNRVGALIFDPHAIGPNEAIVVRA